MFYFLFLMEQHRKIFKIPLDPRADQISFITEIPLDLVNVVDSEEWKALISEINQVFISAESPSWWNVLKLIFVIPAFYKIKTYEKELEKVLDKVNLRLNNKGIRIENPEMNSFIELVVVYIPRKKFL